MLKHWQFHQEYLFFLHETKVNFDSSLRKRLPTEFASSRKELRLLPRSRFDLLLLFYSNTGSPAMNQPQILRSMILMMVQEITNLTRWFQKLKDDDLLAFLIGCSPQFPATSGLLF